MDLFESIVEQVTQKTMGSITTKERQADIATIGKSWDYYDGNQKPYIKRYRGEDEEDYKDKDKPTFNYVKLIVDEYVSGVFGKPVSVEFEEQDHTNRWNEIIDPVSFSNQLPFMKKVQKISEISETALVMVRYNEQRKMPFFEDIRGEFVSFLPKEDNPKEVGTLIISYLYDTGIPDPTKRFMERIEIWDQEKWQIWIYSASMKKREMIAGDVNPYGVIPAVGFKPEEDDNTFYGRSSTRDIVTINETYNNLWTALMRISVYQSFSLLVVQSENEIEIKVAPTRFIRLPQTEKGEVKYVTPAAKIEDVRKVLLSLKEDLQDFSRVPGSVFSSRSTGGAAQSGYALKIKRIPIEQVWESRRLSFGPAYEDLVSLTLHVDAVHAGKNPGDLFLFENRPSIAFSSTTPGLSPQEQLIQDQFDLRYNLQTPVDLMIRKYPSMTRDDALERLQKNTEENRILGAHTAPIDVTGDAAALENIINERRVAEEKAASGSSSITKTESNKDDVDTADGGDVTDAAEKE